MFIMNARIRNQVSEETNRKKTQWSFYKKIAKDY